MSDQCNTSSHKVFWVLSPERDYARLRTEHDAECSSSISKILPNQSKPRNCFGEEAWVDIRTSTFTVSCWRGNSLDQHVPKVKRINYKRRQQVQRICLSFAKGWTDSKQVKLKWIPLKSVLFTRDLRPLGVLPLVVFGCSLQLLQFCSAVHHAEKSVKSHKIQPEPPSISRCQKKKIFLPTHVSIPLSYTCQIQRQLPKWSVSNQLRVTCVWIFKNRKYSR